jgi:hypothetical protein
MGLRRAWHGRASMVSDFADLNDRWEHHADLD